MTRITDPRTVLVLLCAGGLLAAPVGGTSAPGGAVPAEAAAVLTAAVPAALHEELRGASPAADDELSVAPDELRLTFINPIRLSAAHLALVGPDGTVALGEPGRSADAANVLVGPIQGPLVAGEYTVRWQVAGPDGHPVRGEYTFTVLADAEGLAPPVVEPDSAPTEARPSESHESEAFPLTGDFDSGSPLYVLVRWGTFIGLLGAIGVVAFRLFTLSLLRRSRGPTDQALLDGATRRAIGIGVGAGALLALVLLLRLYAQSYALHGAGEALDPGNIRSLLGGTNWATGWWLQGLGTALAVGGFLLARRRSRFGWALATAGASALAFAPAFSGHAAAVPALAPLTVLADGLHVLGAGGWLGSLLIVVMAGLPVALRQTEGRGAAVAALINAFSPTALFFAGMVVATGILSAWLHLGAMDALWTSTYGRTLLLKVAVLSVLFGTGAYNWLKVRPALGDIAAAGRLRRSATIELVVGLLVLAVTAVLVATPPPTETLNP